MRDTPNNIQKSNMNKKPYTMPRIDVVEIKEADLICTSLRFYDEEAGGPVGARGRDYDDYDY